MHGELSSEEWRPVSGWVGIYEVSNYGRLRRVSQRSDAVQHKRTPARILSPKINHHGYARASLAFGGKPFWCSVHTLVAEAFLGHNPGGLTVNHKNGVKSDNRVSNLEWATRRRQGQHAVQRGLQSRAKLTIAAVSAILASPSTPNSVWMEQFGVSRAAIQNVRTGRTWAHVNPSWLACTPTCSCDCHRPR